MTTQAAVRAELCRLRRDIAAIEGRLFEADRLVLGPAALQGEKPATDGFRPRARRGRLPLGLAGLDRVLDGGLPLATLHEIRAGESRDGAAASGFMLALLARLAEAGAVGPVLWISEAAARREAGGLYAPGLAALGLDPGRILQVSVRSRKEALWAFEAALACPGLSVAVCEMQQASLDLSATRRCALRARDAGVTGFLLRLGGEAEPTAAELRFRLSPAPAGTIGRFAAGVGRMAWQLALEKNFGGRTAAFTVEWNAYGRCFEERETWRRYAGPQPVSAAPFDRPPHPAEEGERGAGTVTSFRRAS